MDSSQPAFFLKDADVLPPAFDPRTYTGRNKCSLDAPAWPAPRKGAPPGFPDYDDGRGNLNSLDPYIGVQVGRGGLGWGGRGVGVWGCGGGGFLQGGRAAKAGAGGGRPRLIGPGVVWP